MTTRTTRRLDYIDAAKAIGVLLVIYGHTFRESMRATYAWCDFSYVFVYRFHVSMLFVLSGMGYALTAQANRERPAGQFLRKKARSLLLPWLSYAVLIYLLFALLQLLPPVRALLAGTAYALRTPVQYAVLLLRNENPYSFHLWYLQTLFLFLAATFALDRLLTPRQARAVKLLLLVLVPGFYALFCQRWVWTFKGFFQQYAYFLLGALLPRPWFERKAAPLAFCGTGCGLFIVLETLLPLDALYELPFADFWMAYVDTFAVIGFSLGITAVCYLCQQYLQPLARFGRNTMRYYLYHQPFCCAVLGMVLYDKLHLPVAAVVLACMAAGLVGPYLFHRLTGPLHLRPLLRWLGLPD